MIYFDNAATTLTKPPGISEAVRNAISVMGNPGRSGHAAAMLAADAVFDCRSLAAEQFDVLPTNVIFTVNATHALNIAIRTLVKPKARVVISGFEHNSVTRTLAALQAQTVIAGDRLFDPQHSVKSFEQSITKDSAAVIVNHVSNVFGFVQPLEQIAEICSEKQVPLIVDAAQSAGVLPLSAEKLNAAFIAVPGHKALFGPQGTGMLLCRSIPEPLLYGGTGSYSELQTMPDELPDRIEAGTLNVPGICGLAAGLRFVAKTGLTAIRRREQNLIRAFVGGLRDIENCKVYHADGEDQIGAVSAVFSDADCEQVGAELAAHEIAVRSGLHCSPLAHRSAGTAQTGTVRFSFSVMNTEAEVSDVLRVLKKAKMKEGKL